MKSDIPEIIVIDDAPNAANDFAELIEAQTGFKVKPFDNPNELLDYVTHVNVKVAVIDQVMPVLKGTELFHKIRQIDPNVLAIMLTGEATKEELAKAINVGFSFYLSKNEISKLSNYVLDHWRLLKSVNAKLLNSVFMLVTRFSGLQTLSHFSNDYIGVGALKLGSPIFHECRTIHFQPDC